MGNVMSKQVQTHKHAERRTGWRRPMAIVVSTLAVVAAIDAVASASGTTSEGVVSIAPKAVASAVSIAAGKSVAYVVSGGATTVPTDATRVELSVAVSKQTKLGSVSASPYLDPADASGDSVGWASLTPVTGTLEEPVGVSNKVNFVNNSAGPVTVTIKITGYSTSARLAVRIDSLENRLAADETALNSLPRITLTSGPNAEPGDENYYFAGANLAPGSTVYEHYTYNGIAWNYAIGTAAADGTFSHTTVGGCGVANLYATGVNMASNPLASNVVIKGNGC